VTERRWANGPIPWSAVLAYGHHKQLERDVTDLLWAVVSRMDMVERKWVAEEMRRTAGKGGGG
jgi:hypothetical protein